MTQQLVNRYPSFPTRLRLEFDARLGLFLGDVFGCFIAFLWLNRTGEGLLVPTPNLILLSSSLVTGVGSILYLLDTYQLKSQLLGCSLALRTLFAAILSCCLTAIVLSVGLPGIAPGGWLTLLQSAEAHRFCGVLLSFCGWCLVLRLAAMVWSHRCDRNSCWLMLTDRKTAQPLQAALARWTPQARVSCFVDGLPLTSASPADSPTEVSQAETSQTTDIATDVATDVATDISGGAGLQSLTTWLRRPWTAVLVSPTAELSPDQQQDLMELRLQGGAIYNLVDFCERFWHKLPPNLLASDWFTFQTGFRLNQSPLAAGVKRGCDLALVLVLLLLASPLMLGAAIAIKLSSPGPILYSQLRTGLNDEPFRVYKFRSMYQDAEKRGAQWASERDPRITPVGHWLRILRIDELPQIWNVLRGDMSLIGPRPERPEFDQELAQAIPHYRVRYCVKPGITGWAQVMYPYGASVEDAYEKVSYDFYYIKNYSLWLDLVIVLKTVRVVLFGKGR